jgi:hypothetical protein
MVQRRCQPRFALEAVQPFDVGGESFGQNLDRDTTLQPRVAGAIYFAHPAGAKSRDDLIRPEFRTLKQGVTAAGFARKGAGGHFYRGAFEETGGLLLGRQQRSHFAFQGFVSLAGVPQKSVALIKGALEYSLQQAIDLFPAIGMHHVGRVYPVYGFLETITTGVIVLDRFKEK